MKKQPKEKDVNGQSEVQPDLTELVLKMQQQLIFLEKKIDTLIAKSAERPAERSPERQYSPKPYQRYEGSRGRGDSRQEGGFRDRPMHKAVCADCNNECEVPFRPTQDRPVYCRDCFAKHKTPSDGSYHNKREERRPERGGFRPRQYDKPRDARDSGKKKFYEKKRPGARRRKPRD